MKLGWTTLALTASAALVRPRRHVVERACEPSGVNSRVDKTNRILTRSEPRVVDQRDDGGDSGDCTRRAATRDDRAVVNIQKLIRNDA